jgi:SAM-dependent methyltransferase
MTATYAPEVFDVLDMKSAREIILTDEDGLLSVDRWERETPYLLDVFSRQYVFTDKSVVLDYGCGVGRLAKGLIERYNCMVVGIDISSNMRALAASFVNSPRFVAMAPAALYLLGKSWADCALCVWVLQHCPIPSLDLNYIDTALRFGHDLFVVNEKGRRVPTNHGWAEDTFDIRKALADKFDVRVGPSKLDSEVVTMPVSYRTFVATYRKRSWLNGTNTAGSNLRYQNIGSKGLDSTA